MLPTITIASEIVSEGEGVTEENARDPHHDTPLGTRFIYNDPCESLHLYALRADVWSWLNEQGLQYKVQVWIDSFDYDGAEYGRCNVDFASYWISFPDRNHSFLFNLCWGDVFPEEQS